MNKVRYLKTPISKDIRKKMVFIGGPRQVGKTTLAKQILKAKTSYLNWDNVQHRQLIIKNELPVASGQLIFDEIHKFKNWRNFIVGGWIYDT